MVQLNDSCKEKTNPQAIMTEKKDQNTLVELDWFRLAIEYLSTYVLLLY